MEQSPMRPAPVKWLGYVLIWVVMLWPGAMTAADYAGAPREVVVRALRMVDVRSGRLLEDVAIHIDGERIKAVGFAAEVLKQAPAVPVLDLGDVTILPGLIDCHTHLLARVPDVADGYALNLLIKSEADRALEGAANARATVEAGFTTVRDVGNEGSRYADVALRNAIEGGLVEGPRMRVATRAIAAVGQYYPFRISADLAAFPSGAQSVSGVDEARRAVREQIGNGADLIKVYADWDTATLTLAELQVIVDEAHRANRKVAAHATTTEGIRNAVAVGVDSIEHGNRADRETLETMKVKGIYLVPTLSVMDAWATSSPENAASPRLKSYMEGARQTVGMAHAIGVRIVNGSDPSSSDRHGKNAEELLAMTKRGLSAIEAIRAATTSAADLMGMSADVGAVEAGKYADLIAVDGNPLDDIGTLLRVKFVMKGGRVIKRETLVGQPPR